VNRALLRLSLACLGMFALLLINVNYVQAFESTGLATRPGNVRVFDQQFQYKRGSIVAAGETATTGGTTIAFSRLTKGGNTYQRSYPAGPLYAPVTGYDSIFGATGIEGAENKVLAGTDPRLAVHNLIDLVTGRPRLGATVYLTIDPKAQQAAYAGLKSLRRPSGLVAIDPATGAILAMASYPTYNPNRYATLSGTRLDKIDKQYRHDPRQPLLNRAINETFPPGSSFKVVTGSTWLSGKASRSPQSAVFAPPALKLPNGNLLHNDANESCGNGNPPLVQAFYLSCNSAFGNLGIKVGATALQQQANLFGFNNAKLAVPLPVSASTYPREPDPSLRALSAIGQLDDQVTPMQEAMLAAAIANHGTLMTPYLVQSVQAPDLTTIQRARPSVLSHPVSPQVATEMQTMMIQVVANPAGTAHNIFMPNFEIAGKTGTAQNSSTLDDSVFTCYTPVAVNNRQIAVGVIVKGGGFGAAAAAPIAQQVIKAYLGIR
jgi:cell division protein FtsI/penicillin-binding protein 2